MYAAINGHYEAVKFLIGAGASIEEKDDVSERMFIRTIYIYICVCVCVCWGGEGGILPSYCVISEKYRFIL